VGPRKTRSASLPVSFSCVLQQMPSRWSSLKHRPRRSLTSPFVAMAPCMRVLASDQRYAAIVTPGGPGPNPPKWPVMASGSNATGRDAGPRGQRNAALRRHRLPKVGFESAEVASHGRWQPCDGPGRGPAGWAQRSGVRAGCGRCRRGRMTSWWPRGPTGLAIKRSLVGEHTHQHGVVAPRPGLEVRERAADRLAQATADTDLVTLRLRIATGSGRMLTS
jgi:hypothetical protein